MFRRVYEKAVFFLSFLVCMDLYVGSTGCFGRAAVVVDPVMVATSGDELAGAGILDALRSDSPTLLSSVNNLQLVIDSSRFI